MPRTSKVFTGQAGKIFLTSFRILFGRGVGIMTTISRLFANIFEILPILLRHLLWNEIMRLESIYFRLLALFRLIIWDLSHIGFQDSPTLLLIVVNVNGVDDFENDIWLLLRRRSIFLLSVNFAAILIQEFFWILFRLLIPSDIDWYYDEHKDALNYMLCYWDF